jgi:hypothetical protein
MQVVHCVFVAVRTTTLEHAKSGALLEDETPMLCQRFHKALLQSPQGFKFDVELEGFPPIHLQWMPVGQTAGVLSFPPFVAHPNRPGPDILSLLLNGVESPDDLSALAKRFPLRARSTRVKHGAPAQMRRWCRTDRRTNWQMR